MTTTMLAIVASSWGIAMALAPTLQIRHMIALRSSAGISIPYLAGARLRLRALVRVRGRARTTGR